MNYNYDKIYAILGSLEIHVRALRQLVRLGDIDEEEIDDIARALERLEKAGVVIERKE